jgi:hypothetical protein
MKRSKSSIAALVSNLMLCCIGCIAGGDAKDIPATPAAHSLMTLEGWQVHVDERLINGADTELGKRAVRLLSDKLYEITLLMNPERLKKLQSVHIWLDSTHGKLKAMQYHPNSGWLKSNGYPTELAKCVHIPDAANFANPGLLHQQPYVVLHELSHAYHDQVLGFEEPDVKAAWKDFVECEKYKSTLHIDGKNVKHYGLTDQKEFFAEMSEAYFGMNDFFPFNSAELKREEPKLFELLLRIWGPLQKR